MNDLANESLYDEELLLNQRDLFLWICDRFETDKPVADADLNVLYLNLSRDDEVLDLADRKVLFTNGCNWNDDGRLFKLV